MHKKDKIGLFYILLYRRLKKHCGKRLNGNKTEYVLPVDKLVFLFCTVGLKKEYIKYVLQEMLNYKLISVINKCTGESVLNTSKQNLALEAMLDNPRKLKYYVSLAKYFKN